MKFIKSASLLIVCLLALSSCSGTAGTEGDKISDFWKWFAANQEQLYSVSDPSAPIVSETGVHIKLINEGLAYEVTQAATGKKEIAISADANPELFPLVEQVVSAAPKLDNWRVVAFRQKVPANLLKTLSIGAHVQHGNEPVTGSPDVLVAVKDMRFALKPNGDLTIFMKDYRKLAPQRDMAIIMLQQAVGEYDFVTKLGEVSFDTITSANEKISKPFSELGIAFDSLQKK